MKKSFIFFLTIILFGGCASKNAFDAFDIKKEQQLSVSNLRSSKIVSSDLEVNGLFWAIYLNDIYPDKYSDGDYFYIFFYTKNGAKLDDKNTKISVNSDAPLQIIKLNNQNEFSHLVNIKDSWMNYYLVKFAKQPQKDINLLFETERFFSSKLRYEKNLP